MAPLVKNNSTQPLMKSYVSVRVLHGRVEGDPRDGAVRGALLPRLHPEAGEASAPLASGLLQEGGARIQQPKI